MIAVAALAVASSPELGRTAGACRADDPAPEIDLTVLGLKDCQGSLRLELYPPNDADFLADDDKLVRAGKTFARVDAAIPPQGPVQLCIRAPQPGRYALALLHDRNGNHRFDATSDGVGFAGNPRLGWNRPRAADASLTVGPGRTGATITLCYLRGFAMRPVK